MLLIDVEGFDFEVLRGRNSTLGNAEYVELQSERSHPSLEWGNDLRQGRKPLKSAIDYLDNIGFTCYWAGSGKLWKITECWHPHYDGI